MTIHSFNGAQRFFVMMVALLVAACAALPAQAGDILFAAVEKDGAKVWEGGGAIDLTGPVTLRVKNTLGADHGFSIETMRVQEVLKPGEEKTITVLLEHIDRTVSEHRVYCQLHPKHIAATIRVAK